MPSAHAAYYITDGSITHLYHAETFTDSVGGDTIGTTNDLDLAPGQFNNAFHSKTGLTNDGYGVFNTDIPSSSIAGISFWFKSTSNSNQYFLSDNGLGNVIQINASTLTVCDIACSNPVYFSFSDTTSWHNLIVNISATGTQVYLDGADPGGGHTFNASFLHFFNVHAIGRVGTPTGMYNDTMMDDLVFRNTTFSAADIAAIWNGGTGNEVNASHFGSIKFEIPPAAGGTTYNNQFTQFLLTGHNLESSTPYAVKLEYYWANASNTIAYSTVITKTLFFYPPDNWKYSIPYDVSGHVIGAGSVAYARAQLINTRTGNVDDTETTTWVRGVDWTLTNLYLSDAFSSTSTPDAVGVVYGTSSVPGGFANNSTSTQICTPGKDWTDIGGGLSYGICTGIQMLFVPDDRSTQFFIDGVTGFQHVPPMSFLFDAINTVSSTLTTVATTTTSSAEILDYNGTVLYLPANGIKDLYGQDFKDSFFTLQEMAFWAAAFVGAVGTVILL